jgi:hypothetical protein
LAEKFNEFYLDYWLGRYIVVLPLYRMAKSTSRVCMISHREIYLATEDAESTEIFSTLIDTVFARPAFCGKTFSRNEISSKAIALPAESRTKRASFVPSQAKDTDLTRRAFKNNDQLRTNTTLHKESVKIEFKVIWEK